MENRRVPSLMYFQILGLDADRRTVKRALTSRQVKGRQAVVLLCKQEMKLLRAGKLPGHNTPH